MRSMMLTYPRQNRSDLCHRDSWRPDRILQRCPHEQDPRPKWAGCTQMPQVCRHLDLTVTRRLLQGRTSSQDRPESKARNKSSHACWRISKPHAGLQRWTQRFWESGSTKCRMSGTLMRRGSECTKIRGWIWMRIRSKWSRGWGRKRNIFRKWSSQWWRIIDMSMRHIFK